MADEGAVRVCVRVRPLISREQDLGDATQLHWKTEDRLISQIDGTKSFSFDRVFHTNETTEKVYEEMAVPIICSAIQGYNGTIFAYGQTASGKTYTMMGSADGLGVIPKAINDIFIKIKEIPEREFLLRVSYMEIYNETITDLLCDTRKMKPLEIREDFNRNVYVADLTEEVVSTPELALKWIKKGERNRHYGKTKMNQRSSRSHTIFRMILESREKGDPSNCDGAVMVSHLNLVDLAGSERASQTGSEGLRLKEGCNINRSLFILGQVIKKLSDGQAGGFINYRDSKLTRILQNSLGGNAKTLIICTITPVSFDETLSTLQFASTAKYMKNTPHVNEVLDDEALLKRYRKEIIDLKKQLEEVSSETRVQAMEKDQLAQLLEEKDLLQKVQNDKIHNLTQMLVTSSSVTLEQDLKAKRKRRVTWCPGKTNKMKDIGYVNDFDTTKAIVAKSVKAAAIPSIVEIDESICSEFDVFSNTLETISEMEWNPATKLNQIQEQDLLDSVELCETIISEKNELNVKSQLLKEKEEQIMELQKLLELQRVEKKKTDSSSSVENGEKLYEELKYLKQSLRDTETIALDAKKETAFLKSENQDLKEKMEDLSGRCKQLEKENHQYQSQLEERKDIFKRRQSDLERELQSAFNEITKLTSIIDGKYPKDLLLAVELEKKVKDLQKDLDKEIEENAALQKEIDILSELKSLPTELEILRKESLKKSGELDLIMAEKDKLLTEVVYKDNRLQELLDEIEKTKGELAAAQSDHKTTTQEYQDFKRDHGELEQNYLTMLEEMEKMKHQIMSISEEAHEVVLDLDDLVSGSSVELPQKIQQKTFEQEKLLPVKEELCQAQQRLEEQPNSEDSGLRTVEIESLEGRPGTCQKDDPEQSQETLERDKDQLRKDSQDATNLAIKLNEGENLETPRNLVPLTDYEKDNELLQQQRQISSLIQEKNQLQQMLECVTAEKNQLKTDLEENIEMTIENQEELRSIGAALKKQQEAVIKERRKTAEKEGELLIIQERLADTEEKLHEKIQELQEKEEQMLNVRKEVIEAQEKVNEMEQLRDQIRSQNSTLERTEVESLELAQKLQASLEETASVTKEMNDLKKLQMALQLEKDQLKENIREAVTKGLETEEELKIAQMQLKEHQETIEKLRKCISEQAAQGLNNQEYLEKANAEQQEKIQEFQAKQEQILNVREEVSEVQEKMKEMKQLKDQLLSKDSDLERINLENQELAQKLQATLEETTSVTEERNKLTMSLLAVQEESHQLKENIRELEAKGLEIQGELKITQMNLKEHQETIDRLEECVSEKTAQVSETQEALEKTNIELKKRIQELQEKNKHVCNVREEVTEAQEKVKEVEHLKEQLKSKDSTLERIEMENLELAQKLQASLEETTSVIEERDALTKTREALHMESDQLKETIRALEAKELETQEKLKIAEMDLKEYQETIDKLKVCVSEKTAQVSETQEALEKTNIELKKRIQELQEKKEHVCNGREEVIEAQEKVNEVEHLKEQLKSKDSTLERIEMENLELAQKLQASLEETTSVAKERDALTKTREALHIERDQLKETIRALEAKDLDTEEKLKIAEMHLKEHQETIDKLKGCVLEKTAQVSKSQEALEKNNAELQEKIQELQEKNEHICNVREEVTEAQEKVKEVEHLKEQLKSKDSTLERIEMENLELAQKLQASLEETTSVTEERDTLTKTREALHMERDQLKETIRALEAKDLDTQEKLKIAQMDLKEHQETIDKLKGCVSEKTAQVSETQEAFEKISAELQKRTQELQEKKEHVCNVREVTEAQEKANEVEHLKEQLESKESALERIEMENLELAQKLQASLEETTSVAEERDALTKTREALHIERDQLKETIKDLLAKDLETQEELKIAQMDLKEHQETIDKLKGCILEKEALEKTNAELQEKIQEFHAKQEQIIHVREKVSEAQEKMKEMVQLKEQLKSKDSALERIEMENLELAQKLQASVEVTTSVTEERDALTKTQEALHIERDQLKETIRDLVAKDQKTQEELKSAGMHLKENQEMIDKLKECISEKTAHVSKSRETLEKTSAELQEKTLQLQETEEMLVSMREKVKETRLQRQSLCRLEEQLKTVNHTLSLVETEKLHLTQKLDSSLSKMNTVIQERDALKETEKALQMELSHLKETLKKNRALDQQKPEESVNIEADTEEDIKQHPVESLKEKYLQINELLKKYTMIENRCELLNRLSLDLKRAFENQNQLQVKVQACLSHTPQEAKAVGKLLASNRRCNNDLHSSSTCIMKRLEGVFKRVIDIRREHHNTIHRFEMDLIEEAEKQNDFFIKIQHLQHHSEIGSQELSGYKKLSQKMDLHIEQILRDVSETQNDINNMVAEFQQLLNAKKDIVLSLEMCLSTHIDVESLKIIREENDRIVHVNNLYHNKIKDIMNESSEFEDRSVAVCKEWELEVRQMKDKNEEMVKTFQTKKTALLPSDDPNVLTVGENKKHHLKLRHTRQTTKEIQETAFHEDKENKHKQEEVGQMQKNLEVAQVVSNKHLQSEQPAGQNCQDIKTVSSKEIDGLKMKLVKLNMEKMNESKKFEKEIASKTAVIEHQEEIISQLKENLRRAQQCNDVSMIEPSGSAQTSHTPLTCGGGSGIVQSTKALILKADRVRLEREISKLKQQNEYLMNHQSQLSSNNFHLTREVKKWRERALKKEAPELTRVRSPKSPNLTEITSLKRQCLSPLCKEQTSQETLPKDSPNSWAYDGRSKSLPVTCHNNYFDNSGLGLLPEIAFSSTNDPTKETPREENTGSLLDQWQTSSGKDAPECRTQ
ncbi:centromere-associated protein E isoform X2 [Petaurus breviceps papuanus]|uniref:centromere-associated protein E isoform X2 n=1 Tax=Petaurus breviceps papuanus TaxID=3040969 RepID=UPI0036D8866D